MKNKSIANSFGNRSRSALYWSLSKVSKPTKFARKPLRNLYHQYKLVGQAKEYNSWATQNEDNCFVTAKAIHPQPLMSIIVPVYNPVQVHLTKLVYSIVNQHYENWELILVNASTNKQIRKITDECRSIDTRIKVVTPESNTGISGNTNFGLHHATGEYIVFVDHDDLLHPCALHSVAYSIHRTDADIIYTDEDKINHKGDYYFGPLFKPQWSLDLFRNVNYINHLTVIRHGFVKQVSGLRSELDGAQDYDLIFRIFDSCEPKITHVSHVLYHWRAAKSSTASAILNKNYIFKAGERTVKEHLERNHVNAQVKSITNQPGFYKVTYEKPKTVSLVIGQVEKMHHRICSRWLDELFKTIDSSQIELVIGDWYGKYSDKHKFYAVRLVDDQKQYWKNAVNAVSTEALICFQLAAFPRDKNSLAELIGVALQPHCQMVAPILVSENNTVIDAGLVDADYGLQRLFSGYLLADGNPFGSIEWCRDVKALTLSIFATKKSNFKQLINNLPASHPDALTTEDIRRQGYQENVTGQQIMWAHTVFEYRGMLSVENTRNDSFFNSQLSQASATIGLKLSSWGDLNDTTDGR